MMVSTQRRVDGFHPRAFFVFQEKTVFFEEDLL